MATVVLFHHALGQTSGFQAFADTLRDAGHSVHTPDLFDGQTFDSIEAGMAHAESIGFPEEILARAGRAVSDLPTDVVYAGFSLGVVAAQYLAQTREGASGALFFYSCVPAEAFGAWPTGLRAQIHGMDADPFFVDEGDLEAARALSEANPDVTLYLYGGTGHYFAEPGLPTYDAAAAELLTGRALSFLAEPPL
ncbi:MAG: dienelactone hydrolase family protein [Marmoricola sp.]